MATKKSIEGAGPIDYVREQLADMAPKDMARIAVDADMHIRTLNNIKAGGGAQYDTVMRLHATLKNAERAQRGKK